MKFLEKEYDSERILMYELRDGGTKIYKSNKYEIILCNTIEGNHDMLLWESSQQYVLFY